MKKFREMYILLFVPARNPSKTKDGKLFYLDLSVPWKDVCQLLSLFEPCSQFKVPLCVDPVTSQKAC